MMFRIDLPLWLCLIIPRGGNKGRCSTLHSSFIWLGEDRVSQSESLTTGKKIAGVNSVFVFLQKAQIIFCGRPLSDGSQETALMTFHGHLWQ